MFRYACACAMDDAGVRIQDISAYLRHASIETTAHYLSQHRTARRARAAVQTFASRGGKSAVPERPQVSPHDLHDGGSSGGRIGAVWGEGAVNRTCPARRTKGSILGSLHYFR